MSISQYQALLGENALEITRRPPTQTTIRYNILSLSQIDAIEQLNSIIQPFQSQPHPLLPDLLIVPVYGPNQLQIQTKFIIVDAYCGEAVLRGANIFAPGVIASNKKFHSNELVSIYYSPVPLLRGALTDDQVLENAFHLGNGKTILSRSDILKVNSGVAIEVTEPLFQTISFQNLPKNLFFPQNLPSVVVSHVLNPQPNEYILDMCASPGGKTTHIGSLMANTGQIIALDKSRNRVKQLERVVQTWGLTNVQCIKACGTKIYQKVGTEVFDRVLIDAPCSCMGNKPRLVYEEVNVQSMAKQQQRLLEAGFKLLKKDGVLVYSTCSITPEENEENVEWAIQNLRLELVPQDPILGIDQVYQKFDISGETIGFFIAKFIKTESMNAI